MISSEPIAVAQYLRMSTEHQQYSLQNQTIKIAEYAQRQGFKIVQTYADAARSGLVLKNRLGLQKLLRDVVSSPILFQAVLVYDVSRWGRFQDCDESAHYEFICKQAGIPVHYCAETFANDNTLASMIMKALKRTMAGEYSRELSARVFAGHVLMARLGFKQGGAPGYGLRRMLVTPDRQPKQQLQSGERKAVSTDRVILVPGPSDEVETVREIYRLLMEEKRSIWWIAHELNRRGLRHVNGAKWNYTAVLRILTHPKYVGFNVYGRSSQKLRTPVVPVAESQWVLTPGAYAPLVSEEMFAEARRILNARTINKSNEELLQGLRGLLAREGRLSQSLIRRCAEISNPSTYRCRFGSLRRAFQLIGYGKAGDFDNRIDQRRRTMALCDEFIDSILAIFPCEVSVFSRGGPCRPALKLKRGPLVSIHALRSVRLRSGAIRWLIDPVAKERRRVTALLCFDPENRAVQKVFVAPGLHSLQRLRLTQDDPWFGRCAQLTDLREFCHVARNISRLRRR